ncbi:MAG: hypothetical protein ACYC63_11100 [Armatimonadota bacterium]
MAHSRKLAITITRRQALLMGLAALLYLAAAPCEAAFRPGALVLPFQNTSSYSGHLLGRRAADQLALDLGASGVWRVVDRAQTDKALAQRRLQPPYAVAYLQELAHAVGGDLIFTGTIQKLEVEPKIGRLAVTIYCEATDQVSGQSVLATVQTGESRRNDREPVPTDVLIGHALADACAKVAAAAARSTGVVAEVTDPNEAKAVTLKLPAGSNIATGSRFLLYRGVLEGQERVPGKLIGSLMVTEVRGEMCTARVLARSGDIHSGDIAVSVCLPEAN